jgi:hypothetical protein
MQINQADFTAADNINALADDDDYDTNNNNNNNNNLTCSRY